MLLKEESKGGISRFSVDTEIFTMTSVHNYLIEKVISHTDIIKEKYIISHIDITHMASVHFHN